ERHGNHMVLRDLGSMNGTYINGQRVNGSQYLQHGDEIRMGNTILKFDDGYNQWNFDYPPACPGIALHMTQVPVTPQTPAAGTPGWVVKKRTAQAIEIPKVDHLVNVDNSARHIGVQVSA